MKVKIVSLLLLTVLLLPVAQFGQTDRGTIVGIVTDGTGAVVPGAAVTATRVGTTITFRTTSTATGNFTVPALQPGEYALTIESVGFKTFRRTNIVVIAGGTTHADASLEVGAVTESVEVVSTVAQLQSATAEVVSQVSTTSAVAL